LQSSTDSLSYLIVFDDRGRVFTKAGKTEAPPAPGTSPRAEEALVHAVLPLRIGSERVGELRYGLSLAALRDTRATLLKQGTFIALAGLILTLAGLMAMGVWLTRDVDRLVTATQAIAAGQYGVKAKIESSDEIGQLARHFNMMGDSIRINLQELLIKQSAIESSLNGIAMAGMDGKITYVNPAFLRLWGLGSPEQAIGHLPGEFGREAEMIIETVRREGKWQGEQRERRPDGSVVDLYVSVHMVKDKDGQPVCVMASFHDIGARKRAEAALNELNLELEARVVLRTAELQAANAELESFSYSVAHDLRAPLRGIDGYSQLLMNGYADKIDDEGRHFLQKTRQAAQQMGELIDDLLAYSRLERAQLQSAEVYPRELIEAILAERAEEIKQREVAVSLTVPDIPVTADSDGLRMAIRNLLENALKFSRDAPKPKIEIAMRESDDKCILSVRDNGTGFDMKYHDRIFGIFERLHRSEDYPGTGIGLAIVQKAMTRMGGRVWAESESGEGATFYLEIPRRA
jgi:PAS domain S-box-containing protein